MGSVKGTPALNGEAVKIANAKAAYVLRSMGVHKAEPVVAMLVKAVLVDYLKAAKVNRENRGNLPGPYAKKIAMLEPGEHHDFAEVSPQLFRNYFETARKILGEPDAAWLRRPQKGTGLVRIIRLAPGQRPAPDPRDNPKAVFMAAMTVGTAETRPDLFQKRNQLGSSVKIQARRILNQPDADWRASMTNKGLQVRRVS